MRSVSLSFFCCILFFISSAQHIAIDTFIRKDGIHIVPSFEPWNQGTLFGLKKTKGKQGPGQPLLNIESAERIKLYMSSGWSAKKVEPFIFFRVLNDLQAHDSVAYFQMLVDMPPGYQAFFKGLYEVEANRFDEALALFDKPGNSAASDSLILIETPFWKRITQKMLDEQLQHNAVSNAYALMENSRIDSSQLMGLLNEVVLPQYLMHKYISLYNYNYRKKDYATARAVYDSILAYANQPKMKASLVKNRHEVIEMLEGKHKFIAAVKNGLYHYEIDYLYDHLEAWKQDTITDNTFSAMAGFTFNQRLTTKSDSVFTRRLTDTAANELLSKYEMLSLIRTPLDKANRRFLIVKLGFSKEETYNKYVSFLSKFKSKPILQSILYNKGGITEGDEYMLSQYFIAALYRLDDPLIKYELSLYALQDAEGNVYAVDTLF